MTYTPTGKPLSEAQLIKFKWWYELYLEGLLTMWELQVRFGQKVEGGLVKPMSRQGIFWRLDLLKERGLRLDRADK